LRAYLHILYTKRIITLNTEQQTQDQILADLETIAEREAAIDTMSVDREAVLSKFLTPENLTAYHAAIYVLESSLAREVEVLEALKSSVRERVLELKHSVNGVRKKAVYTAGKKSWDTKGLEGYAVSVPAILAFQKVGAPSVAIR